MGSESIYQELAFDASKPVNSGGTPPFCGRDSLTGLAFQAPTEPLGSQRQASIECVPDLAERFSGQMLIEQMAVPLASGLGVRSQIEVDSMGADQIVFHADREQAVARPRKLPRGANHSGPHWIHLYVFVAIEQVAVRFNGARPKSSFPQGAGSFVQVIERRNVFAANPLNGPRKGKPATSGCEKMNVIGHQDIRMHRDFVAFRSLDEASMEMNPVALRSKYRFAIVAADHRVDGQIGKLNASAAGHGT